jgi:hypothetical protein
MIDSTKLRLGLAGLALAGVTALGASAAASADTSPRLDVTSVKIKGDKPKNLHFDAPAEVVEDSMLAVENRTKPNKVGPHSFSLVTKPATPKGKDEFKKCEKLTLRVCEDVAEAHDVEFGPGPPVINNPDADNGLPGWDLPFDGHGQLGDSYFFDEQGESETRAVNVDPGKLRFFCVVHANMKGSIKVVPAAR